MTHQDQCISPPMINKYSCIERMEIEANFNDINSVDIFRNIQGHGIVCKDEKRIEIKCHFKEVVIIGG